VEQLHRKNYDMKRKYYLRGLGIGILVTALVFAFTGPKEMTDDEIIKRAEELGYVKEEDPDSTINLKDLLETGTPTPSPISAPTSKPGPTEIPEETTVPTDAPTFTPTPTVEPSATVMPTPTKAVEPTAEPTPTPVPTVVPMESATPQPTATAVPTKGPEEIITAEISVERGNTATAVCNKIQAAGIVEDGVALKEYLVEHQMTDYINIGVYTLSSDMTYEEIAKILTGR